MNNRQWHDDQGSGERALREHERKRVLDTQLGDALRASGVTADDARAVETLYAVAGSAGTHRIVSAMRALQAWLLAARGGDGAA